MRCFARDLRAYDHPRQAALSDPLLGSRNEFCPDARASAGVRDDKPADLTVGFHLQMVHDAHVDPADYGAIAIRHENDTIRQMRIVANSFFHCGGGDGVAEFAAQFRYRFGIGDIDGTYLNIHAPTLAWLVRRA